MRLILVLFLIPSQIAFASEPESGGGGGHGGGKSPPPSNPSTTGQPQPHSSTSSSITLHSNSLVPSSTGIRTPLSTSSVDSAAAQGINDGTSVNMTKALPVKTVGVIVAAAVVGTALITILTWLLYRRRLHRSRERAIDLIAKDSIRSVDGSSPAGDIEPYPNHADDARHQQGRALAPIVIPGSPVTSYGDPARPLSSTYSHVDHSRPLSTNGTDTSFYNAVHPRSPVSEKLPLNDTSMAGTSKLQPPISTNYPGIANAPESGTPMREVDSGVSIMSSEGVLPPAYVATVEGDMFHVPSRSNSPSSGHIVSLGTHQTQ